MKSDRLSRPLVVLAALTAFACGSEDGLEQHDAGLLDASVDASTLPTDELEVLTTKGKIRGQLSAGVRAFLGIPYGAPPVGERRWRPPLPASSWEGTRDAKAFGAVCPQLDNTSIRYDTASSEDCLFLNVWAPELPSSTPLPVMVWLHGGAYVFGSGAAPYNGEALVKAGNVIIVTVNYRLGALGYLAHPALAAEAGDEASSNFGLLDQRLALQWVRDNIAAFGGDKDKVTLFGQSAGANSTCLHLMSAGSQGLFQRAIIQSGLCMLPLASRALADSVGARYATALGCTDPGTTLTCLRALTPAVATVGPPLIPATPGGVFYQDRAVATPTFWPNVDGKVVAEQPASAFSAGRIAKVPVLHGAATSEGTLFHLSLFAAGQVTTTEQYEAALRIRFGERTAEVMTKYPAPADLERVTGDSAFRCGSWNMARYLTAASVPNYLYSFDLALEAPLPQLLGRAFHSADIPYVFANSYVLGSVPADRIAARDAIMGYWTRFATTGDPNGAGAAAWPLFDASPSGFLSLASTIARGTDWGGNCAFWEGVASTPL